MNILEHLGSLVSEKIALFKTLAGIFKLEAKLAALSIVPLIITVGLLFLVTVSFWISLIVLIGYFALLFLDSIPLMLALILGLHLIFLLGLSKYLSYNLNNLSFKHTRKCLSAPEE